MMTGPMLARTRFLTAALTLLASACSCAASGPAQEPAGAVCTRDARICPDGSSVGRSGPNCEFAACPEPAAKACTEEAKVCPDGSAVGRTGPNCEFAACPGA